MEHLKLPIQAACIAVVFIILLAGLWPFEFSPSNQVSWLGDRDGLQISSLGIVYSQKKVTLASGHFSIEVLMEPAQERTQGIDSLLELFDGRDFYHLSLGQWNSYLILRGPKRGSKRPKDYFEIGLDSVFHEGVVRHLIVTSGSEGVSIYVNGELKKFTPKYQFTGDNGILDSYLILGNSSSGDNQWHGMILGLFLYDGILPAKEVRKNYLIQMGGGASITRPESDPVYNYRFNKHGESIVSNRGNKGGKLLIPETFTVLRKQVLVPPWENFKLNRSYLRDVVINILGFIPFGFLMALYLMSVKKFKKGRTYLAVATFGATISLSVEMFQVFIPVRSSSSTDLILNILGTIIGIHLAILTRRRTFLNSEPD